MTDSKKKKKKKKAGAGIALAEAEKEKSEAMAPIQAHSPLVSPSDNWKLGDWSNKVLPSLLASARRRSSLDRVRVTEDIPDEDAPPPPPPPVDTSPPPPPPLKTSPSSEPQDDKNSSLPKYEPHRNKMPPFPPNRLSPGIEYWTSAPYLEWKRERFIRMYKAEVAATWDENGDLNPQPGTIVHTMLQQIYMAKEERRMKEQMEREEAMRQPHDASQNHGGEPVADRISLCPGCARRRAAQNQPTDEETVD